MRRDHSTQMTPVTQTVAHVTRIVNVSDSPPKSYTSPASTPPIVVESVMQMNSIA